MEKYNDKADLGRGGDVQGKLSGGESLILQLAAWLEKSVRGQSPLLCVAHFWKEVPWVRLAGGAGVTCFYVLAAREAGKSVSWILLWGGRVCKGETSPKHMKSIQKAWAARKHDKSLYTGTVLGTRDEGVSTTNLNSCLWSFHVGGSSIHDF